MFEIVSSGSDVIPEHVFYGTTFIDCESEALGYFSKPPESWAIIKDCGEFPCTGPLNFMYSFYGNSFTGNEPAYGWPTLSLIPNTPDVSEYIEGCEFLPSGNLWYCNQDELRIGILTFESEDADKLDRSVHPVYVRLLQSPIENKVNSFMDHVWDGLYTK